MSDLSIVAGGGAENPTIATSGSPQQYVSDILSFPDKLKEDGGKDHYSHSSKEHSKKHGEEGGSFLERHKFLRWAVYGLAAFGAWKLGMNKLIKTTFQHLKNLFGPLIQRARASLNV
jgi:hypothetical protein